MVTVIDYGAGNLRSVAKALEAVGAEVCVSSNVEDVRRSERLVLPGVGAFAKGMENLRASGLTEVLSEEVRAKGKPLLAICLGMQLLATEGHENGAHPGLNWIPASVVEFDLRGTQLKVPHVGWNEVVPNSRIPLLCGLGGSPTFYFVHSYHVLCKEPNIVVATSEYGIRFTAAIQYRNIFGTQFHPEKSQDNGLLVLRNFISWNPSRYVENASHSVSFTS